MIESQPRPGDPASRPEHADDTPKPHHAHTPKSDEQDEQSAKATVKDARRLFDDCQDADKMLLRWVRASLALMGTGVGMDRALAYLSGSAPGLDPFHVLRLVGQGLTLIGIGALWIACYQHWETVSRLRAGRLLPVFQIPLALCVGVGVSVLGAIALLTVALYK